MLCCPDIHFGQVASISTDVSMQINYPHSTTCGCCVKGEIQCEIDQAHVIVPPNENLNLLSRYNTLLVHFTPDFTFKYNVSRDSAIPKVFFETNTQQLEKLPFYFIKYDYHYQVV